MFYTPTNTDQFLFHDVASFIHFFTADSNANLKFRFVIFQINEILMEA